MFLNLTQRQACEQLFSKFDKQTLYVEKWIAALADVLLVFDSPDQSAEMSFSDFLDYGLCDDNLSLNSIQLFDDGLSKKVSGVSKAISLKFHDVSWVQDSECFTIMDYVTSLGYDTMVEAFGSPLFEIVSNAGFPNIFRYVKQHFQYGSSYCSCTLAIYYGDIVIDIAHFSIDKEHDTVIIRSLLSDDNYEEACNYIQALGLCSQVNSMLATVASALSNNLCTPSELLASLSRFQNSSWAAVRDYVATLVNAGANAVLVAIGNFVSLFRGANDYTENDDGTITWNTIPSVMDTSVWVSVRDIFSTGAQIIGGAMLAFGGVAVKILGGALMLVGSIVQTVSTAIGQVTGTAPVVYDEAVDDIYATPVFQGKETIPISYLSKASETYENLVNNQRSKIVTPWAIIFMYNATFSDDEVTVEYKIFPRIRYANVDIGRNQRGLRLAVLSDGVYRMQFACDPSIGTTMRLLNQRFVASPILDIVSNSPDANAWTNLWVCLASSVVTTMYAVLCSPVYRDWSTGTPVNPDSGVGSDDFYSASCATIGPYFWNIVMGLGADVDSAYLRNGVAFMGLLNHQYENILMSILFSIGLLDIPQDILSQRYGSQDLTLFDGPINLTQVEMNYFIEQQSNDPTAMGFWDVDNYTTLQFLCVDKCAYVTPPEHSFKSVLYGAILTTAIIGLVVIATVVIRSAIKKKFKPRWLRKGQELANEGKRFRDGLTNEQWNNMSQAEKAEWETSQRKYD